MSDGLRDCLERLHLGDNKKLRHQAQELVDQLNSVASKALKNGPNCKPVIAIQLACESFQLYEWNVNLAAQLAGCSVKGYEDALSAVRKQLNIQPSIALGTLATALGSTTMLSFAERLWNDFEKRYKDSLTGAKKNSLDEELKLSCWKGAVIYSCAKAFGDKLSKSNLIRLCSCSSKELNACIKAVESACSKLLAEFKEESHSKTKKKKRAEEVEETIRPKKKIVPVSGISSMVDHRDYKETRRYKSYMIWHSKMVEKLVQMSK